jgi:hypothetical protein
LNYAHPTLKVILLQLGIDQNVDEIPIFAGGFGVQAAIISARALSSAMPSSPIR